MLKQLLLFLAALMVSAGVQAATRPNVLFIAWKENSFAVQTERYRHIRYGDGSEVLYDHKTDLKEWKNLAGDPALESIKRQMSAALEEQIKESASGNSKDR